MWLSRKCCGCWRSARQRGKLRSPVTLWDERNSLFRVRSRSQRCIRARRQKGKTWIWCWGRWTSLRWTNQRSAAGCGFESSTKQWRRDPRSKSARASAEPAVVFRPPAVLLRDLIAEGVVDGRGCLATEKLSRSFLSSSGRLDAPLPRTTELCWRSRVGFEHPYHNLFLVPSGNNCNYDVVIWQSTRVTTCCIVLWDHSWFTGQV